MTRLFGKNWEYGKSKSGIPGAAHAPRFPLALKNLAGALHTDGGGCTLTVGREDEAQIPADPSGY